MRKKDELASPSSCMQKAHPNEMVFVLLGRDVLAPRLIREWVADRLRVGKNVETDPQITEALACAEIMENEGRTWVDDGRTMAEMLAGGGPPTPMQHVQLPIEDMAALDFVQWDRYSGTLDTFDVFGWIARDDGRADFVILQVCPEGIGFTTSSAKYIVRRLAHDVPGAPGA